jgi:transcriptional regulator with XRE-family HTH domain
MQMSEFTRNQEIGSRMKQAAQRAGLGAEAVAEALGVKSETVYRYYQGQIEVSVERLSQFSRMAGVPVYSLYAEAEVENLLEWLEATARHQAELSPDNQRRLNEALDTLSEWVGPVPTSGDDQDWNEYLDQLRRFFVQAHKGATEDRGPRE